MVDFLLKDTDPKELDKLYEQAKNATDAAGKKKYTPEQLKQLKANLDKVRGTTPQPTKASAAPTKAPRRSTILPSGSGDRGLGRTIDVGIENPQLDAATQRKLDTDARIRERYKHGIPPYKSPTEGMTREEKLAEHKKNTERSRERVRQRNYKEEQMRDKAYLKAKQEGKSEEEIENILAGVSVRTDYGDPPEGPKLNRDNLLRIKRRQLNRGEPGYEGKTLADLDDHERKIQQALGNHDWEPPAHEETPLVSRRLDSMEARQDAQKAEAGGIKNVIFSHAKRAEQQGTGIQKMTRNLRAKSRRNAEDDSHQLAVGRRDGETDKLYSPAGSTIQAEHVGAVSKAILKQGLLDVLLRKKEDIKALIPSPEEKDETQSELPELIGVDDDPHKGKISNVQAYNKSKKLKKAKKKGYSGKDPLEGEINETDDLHANADMGVMSYMAKTHFGSEPVSYDGDREARIKATRDHFQHLLLKTTCLCEKRGVVMAIGIEKGIGDVARKVVGGVKGKIKEVKQGRARKANLKRAVNEYKEGKPVSEVYADYAARGAESRMEKGILSAFKKKPSGKEANINISHVMGDSAKRERLTDALSGTTQAQRDSSRDAAFRDIQARKKANEANINISHKMMKSGNGSPLASAEKPVAVMAAEQSGLYSVDGKNLDLDPLANKAAMENVNQTDASTRSIDVTTDSRGRKTFHQKAEPTICSSKAVFNSILEKTYYDDQVLERYKNAGKDDKNKSKRRHITNDITDTAGQQTNKTRGI